MLLFYIVFIVFAGCYFDIFCCTVDTGLHFTAVFWSEVMAACVVGVEGKS